MAPSAVEHDALLLLRQSIAAGASIVPTSSSEPDAPEVPLSQATHLRFTNPISVSLPVDTPTRFISNESPVGLRSIYFAWLNREVAIPDYNASATKLNEELGGDAAVHKFAFVERLDLITWLEGASEESEYIRPLSGDKETIASATKTLAATAPSRAGRGTLDPRMAVIYNGERKMSDHNSVLRGIKPTDFSHVRKLAAPFMSKKPGQQQAAASAVGPSASLALNPKPSSSSRRPDPIILLSPSASSLLRLSNIKSFLESGRYVPPDNSSTATMLHLTRTMKDIDPARPLRFILVEGPEQFKPEYWNRVVAVFTTGQAWQFKNYKWSNPSELFRHVQGIYIGWRGDPPPPGVRELGHRVMTCTVEKWRDPSAPSADENRWRDREVVEAIWKAIEGNMRSRGWKRDSGAAVV